LLDELSATRVLDVGSGYYGLSWYRSGKIVQTDLAFPSPIPSPRPPTKVRRGKPLYVQASASELPCATASFDAVVSLDLMEHLPESLRSVAMAEMARVSKGVVIIGFPVGRLARWSDAALGSFFRVLRWDPPDWLIEHRSQASYPTRDTVAGALPSGWTVTREIKNGNVLAHLAVVIGETLAGAYLKHVPGLGRNWKWPTVLDRGPTYRQIFVLVHDV
jgi:hypothetical protein